VTVPAKGQSLEITGQGFPGDLSAEDFHLGAGVIVTRAERLSSERVRLAIDVLANAELGARAISFRAIPGPKLITLYDAIDYLKVTPEQGFARVGGAGHPKQFERFEALAMCRGKDGKPFTDDDFVVKPVPATWRLEEFPVRENDDDVNYVGALDSATGVFTPAIEGPNPKRKYKANNIGDVYVVAEATVLTPDPPKPASQPAESRPPSQPLTRPASRPESAGAAQPTAEPATRPATRPAIAFAPPLIERKLKARGRLLVTVPLYVKWDRYVWDHR
jgi:quinohemoprotein amine dehydrogenase